MSPVVAIQLISVVKLIIPHQRVAIGGIIGRFFGCSLRHIDGLAGGARHQNHLSAACLCESIGRNRHCHTAFLRGCALLSDGEEITCCIGIPLSASSGHVDDISLSVSWCIDGLERGCDGYRGLWLIAVSTAAQQGHGER